MGYIPRVVARQTLRSSATAITTSYDSVGIPETRLQNMNALELLCDLTLNTATSVEIQVEVAVPAETASGTEATAPAASDWYALSSANISGLTVGSGVITAPTGALVIQLAATGKYAIVLKDLLAKWVRVKAKTTAGPGTTTLNIIGVEGLV
jgi:hypothetical protein